MKKNQEIFRYVQIYIYSNKPVIIPKTNRFLHTLILGASGTGKLSQEFIPMINQDMENNSGGIIVMDSESEFTEKIYAMARYYNKDVVYLNPTFDDSICFNPLKGREDSIVESIDESFRLMYPKDEDPYLKDINSRLVRNSLKILKRVKGDDLDFRDFKDLITAGNKNGESILKQFSALKSDDSEIENENCKILTWFNDEYYKINSSIYKFCFQTRNLISRIISNKYLNKTLLPSETDKCIDFDKYFLEKKIIIICTAQWCLRDLGTLLGYLITTALNSAIFNRPGCETTRIPYYMYINNFGCFANISFADLFVMGSPYRVACTIGSFNRDLLSPPSLGRSRESFKYLICSNIRNVILFPGSNSSDARYYEDVFKDADEYLDKKEKKLNKRKEPMTAPNIMFRDWGEVSYNIYSKLPYTHSGFGKTSYIDSDLNKELDRMVYEYRCLHEIINNK